MKRYEEQKARGTEGFGYIAVEDGYIKRVVRAKTEEEIMAKLETEVSNEILFHHRKPTSTPNYVGAAHPLEIFDPKILDHKYFVVHNGVISNDISLKREHETLGVKYQTEYTEQSHTRKTVVFPNYTEELPGSSITTVTKHNDSEAFAWELALFLDGYKNKIEARGTISFIAYQTDENNKIKRIFWGHNQGNPLVIEMVGKKDDEMVVLKSLGKGDDVPTDVIYSHNYETGETTEEEVEVGTYYGYKSNNVGYGKNKGWDGPNHQRALLPVVHQINEPPAHVVSKKKEDEDTVARYDFKNDLKLIETEKELEQSFLQAESRELLKEERKLADTILNLEEEIATNEAYIQHYAGDSGLMAYMIQDRADLNRQLKETQEKYDMVVDRLQDIGYYASPIQTVYDEEGNVTFSDHNNIEW